MIDQCLMVLLHVWATFNRKLVINSEGHIVSVLPLALPGTQDILFPIFTFELMIGTISRLVGYGRTVCLEGILLESKTCWGHGQSSDGHQIWSAETETKTWWYCGWRSFKKWSLAMLTRLNAIFFCLEIFYFSIPAFLSLNILPYMSIKTGAQAQRRYMGNKLYIVPLHIQCHKCIPLAMET